MWTANCMDEVCEGSTNPERSFVMGWPTCNCVATFRYAHTHIEEEGCLGNWAIILFFLDYFNLIKQEQNVISFPPYITWVRASACIAWQPFLSSTLNMFLKFLLESLTVLVKEYTVFWGSDVHHREELKTARNHKIHKTLSQSWSHGIHPQVRLG